MTATQIQVVRECIYQLTILVKVYGEGHWTQHHEGIYTNILTALASHTAMGINQGFLHNEELKLNLKKEGIE